MTKQILSVRDFAILYNVICREIARFEEYMPFPFDFTNKTEKEELKKEHFKDLEKNQRYQDLIRIKNLLGNLNIEVETSDVKIETN